MYVPILRQFVVDCEYSSETNELISMAIVPLWTGKNTFDPLPEPEREFYEVIDPLPSQMSDWVQQNVVPHLQKPGISYAEFQQKLQAFLLAQGVQMIHYDWCDDIAYFNRALITGPGERLELSRPYLAHIHHTNIEYDSLTQHNALEDARAMAAAIRRRCNGMD